VADASNNRLRTVYLNGTVATLAGTGGGSDVDSANALTASFAAP
jgi:hypothetical protein